MTPLAALPNHRCSSPGNSKPLCLLDHSTPRAAVCLHRRPLTVQQTTCSTVSWTRPGCCYAAPQHQQHQPQQAQLQQAAASSDNQQLQYPLVERKFDHNWRSPLAGAATPACHRRHLFYSWCVVSSTCKAKAHSNIQTNTANALAEPLHMLCLSLHGPSFSWSCCVHAQVYACPVARTPSSWHKLHFQACQRHSTPNIHHLIICDVFSNPVLQVMTTRTPAAALCWPSESLMPCTRVTRH